MRTTIYLDPDLNRRLRSHISGRGLNRFINEAVAEKVDSIERQQLDLAMAEGYIAGGSDVGPRSATDWEVIDLEDWPD